MEAAVAANGAI